MFDAIFEYNGWDQIDTMIFTFYECTIVIDIGQHKMGSNFDTICMDYQKGTLTLQRDTPTQQEWVYHIGLSIGDLVDDICGEEKKDE